MEMDIQTKSTSNFIKSKTCFFELLLNSNLPQLIHFVLQKNFNKGRAMLALIKSNRLDRIKKILQMNSHTANKEEYQSKNNLNMNLFHVLASSNNIQYDMFDDLTKFIKRMDVDINQKDKVSIFICW